VGGGTCNFSIFKKTDGAEFNNEMMARMLNGEILKNIPCFTKEGEEYLAGFRINENGELVKISYHGGKK
jgi:hypothetical protein